MELKVSEEIREMVRRSYGDYFSGISGIDADKLTDDALSLKKPDEQIAILRKFYPCVEGKKLLEIGSGFGNFLLVTRKQYNIDAYGVEPAGDGFGNSDSISKKILLENGVDPNVIFNGRGEALPFSDNSFDLVFSTNVLEHVESPEMVLGEAIRVCKKGGIIQIVVPNYGSFFDGHYACFYLPYQPKWLWKIYLKYFLGRPVDFVDELRTEINYFSMKRMIDPFVQSGDVLVLSWGDEVFRERMRTADFSDWAGLGKVKAVVKLLKMLKIASAATWVLLKCNAFTPIILTMRKNA